MAPETPTSNDVTALTTPTFEDDTSDTDAGFGVVTLGEKFLEGLQRLPSSRAISIAKTKTEEAVMWLNKNIYRNA